MFFYSFVIAHSFNQIFYPHGLNVSVMVKYALPRKALFVDHISPLCLLQFTFMLDSWIDFLYVKISTKIFSMVSFISILFFSEHYTLDFWSPFHRFCDTELCFRLVVPIDPRLCLSLCKCWPNAPLELVCWEEKRTLPWKLLMGNYAGWAISTPTMVRSRE